MQWNALHYFAETGRTWGGEALDAGAEVLYMTVHAERWAMNEQEWAIGYVKDLVMNAGKTVLVVIR